MTMTEDTINERQKTHGNFADNADTFCALMDALPSAAFCRLPSVMRAAIAMDLMKLARICSGDSLFLDHWLDRAGYNERVIDWLRPAEKAADSGYKPKITPEDVQSALRWVNSNLAAFRHCHTDNPSPYGIESNNSLVCIHAVLTEYMERAASPPCRFKI